MRLVGFVVGVVAVLLTIYIAIVMQMVGGVAGHVMVVSDFGVWAAVGVSLVGTILVWRRALFAAVAFGVAALWLAIVVREISIPAVIFLLAAGVIAFLHYRNVGRSIPPHR